MAQYYRGVPRPFLIVPQTVCGKLEVGVWYEEIQSDENSEWWTTPSVEVALRDANTLSAQMGVPVYVIQDTDELYWVVSKAVM